MKCQFCENEANVFYTQVIDGKSKKMNLCDSCAEEQGVTSLEEFKIADILMSDEAPKNSPDNEITIDMSECSHCGFTLDDLRKIGRLGCSHCYSQFGSEIKSMLKNMHRGTKHKGKMPVGMIAAMKEKRQHQKLQTALDRAIADEDYEQAAEITNKLKALKSEGKKKNKKGEAKK